MEILAIIPARGGSKGIPRKNIKLLGGIPLIAYSIAAGLQSTSINRVVVSTDDDKIAKYASLYGAEVPFMRPDKLAEDNTTDLPVLKHAIDWLETNESYKPDIIVMLRPTSPFRPLNCLNEAINHLVNNPEADCIRSVMKSGQEPYKMWQINKGEMIPLLKSDFAEHYNMPRQKLPQTYWQTGQIEAIRYNTIMNKESISGDRIWPIIMDPKFVIDIDDSDQWEYAEHMLRKFHETNVIYFPDKDLIDIYKKEEES
jgi:N-acylneuraminate cytidylyltransferase